jgi:hypothetical protein
MAGTRQPKEGQWGKRVVENEFVDGLMDVQLNPKLKASHYCACGFIPLNWVNLYDPTNQQTCAFT